MPTRGGSIEELRPFLNLTSDEDFALVVGWMVAAVRPRGPYPVCVLCGEQGTAKSTTARVMRRSLDPSVSDVRAEPREPRDLMIAATNGHIVNLDNIRARLAL